MSCHLIIQKYIRVPIINKSTFIAKVKSNFLILHLKGRYLLPICTYAFVVSVFRFERVLQFFVY